MTEGLTATSSLGSMLDTAMDERSASTVHVHQSFSTASSSPPNNRGQRTANNGVETSVIPQLRRSDVHTALVVSVPVGSGL
jgi:hypothetical protein